jgi:long-chain fatty acid transport protein
MKNKSLVIRSAILATIVAGFSSQLQASGFALIENNASGQGNAYAGAAAIANDASTVWFNPAGMMMLENDQIVAVVHSILPESSFNDRNTVSGIGTPVSGSNDDGADNAFVPNFFYVVTIDDNLKFGLGVNAPFGLKTEYDDNWVGRYHAIESELKTININPSIAFKTSEKLSIGLGINIMAADVTLSSAIDFGALLGVSGSADGFADLSGDNYDDWAYGVNLGLVYEPKSGTRVGIAYRSKITLDVEGDARFSNVPPLPPFSTPIGNVFDNTSLKASVTLPDSLSLSFASDADKVTVLADITWTGWSSFDELRIQYTNVVQPDSVTTEDWEDTIRLSLGADYRLSNKLTVRGGWAYDETPIPSAERRTARIPGNTRRWVSAGFSYKLSADLAFDLGYSHLFISDTPIKNTFESSIPPLNGTLDGTYDASVDILSLQLTWNI